MGNLRLQYKESHVSLRTLQSSSVPHVSHPRPAKMGHPALLYLSIFLSAVGGFLFGYDTGVIAGAMPLIERDVKFWGEKGSDEATLWLSLITSMTVAFAFIFSFVGGWITERFGRRPAILVASVVFTVGAVVMAVAPTKAVLLVGRIVVGMGIGIASMCIPVYMAETSPVELRGFLGASFQVMICFGQVVAAIVDALFGEVDNGWKYDFGLAGIPSVILLVGFFFCPESPRWLVQVGREEDAKKALEKLRKKGDGVDQELSEIKEIVAEDKKIAAMTEGGGTFSRALKDPNVRKALIVGCSLQLFQQLIGINTVIYYSARILMMSGISRDMTMILWLSALVAAINFFASFLGMALIDRLGRRILALGSYSGILVSLVIIALGFQLSEQNTTAADTSAFEPSLPGDPSSIYATCADFMDCNACTQEYDDFNCGFCYEEDESANGQGKGSCVPWEWPVDSKEPKAIFGRCNSYNSTMEPGVLFAAEYCKTRFSPIILVGLITYLISFQAGVGPVPWVYNPEIYPLWFRSTGVSMSTGFNWSLNLIVTFTFPYLQQVTIVGKK